MDRDEFIIAVLLIVCEQYAAIKEQYGVRRGGFAPALSDEEVIAIEICGEYFKIECDKDAFRLFSLPLPAFFFQSSMIGLYLPGRPQICAMSNLSFKNI